MFKKFEHFSFCSQLKCWLSGMNLTECLSEWLNREDSDQTASSEFEKSCLSSKEYENISVSATLVYNESISLCDLLLPFCLSFACCMIFCQI